MSHICFVTWELHPTTWGGCGVLLHHAAQVLLDRGHRVTFLLDMTRKEFEQFVQKDRLELPQPHNCQAFHVDELCADFPWTLEHLPNRFQYASLRFAHAMKKLSRTEQFDFVEFFEYCGSGYYSLATKLYESLPQSVWGMRLHNSIELINYYEATRPIDPEVYVMYALERGGIDLAEAVLSPTRKYFEAHYRDFYNLPPERVAISQSPREEFGYLSNSPSAGPLKIIYLGRVNQFKGVEQLIKAALMLIARQPELDCIFDIIGPDSEDSPQGNSYIAYLRHMIPPQLLDRFKFPGHLSHEEVALRLMDASFAVFPNRFESFCYALHEIYSAGVPVIIADLPGFRDFFTNDVNCLIYDGTTQGLLHAMERMAGDPAFRKKISKPYPVATEPLGTFYEEPKALSPVASNGRSAEEASRALVVLVEDDAKLAEVTMRSLRAQTCKDFRCIRARAATENDSQSLQWLGRLLVFFDEDGKQLYPLSIETEDALLILQSGDTLEPQWMELCMGALRKRSRMAFAGTWAWRGDQLFASTLDLAPEAHPVWHGNEFTRSLLRTPRGELLVELFDPTLGPLGEIGYVWQAVAKWGRGVLYPQPILYLADTVAAPANPKRLTYLLARYGGDFGNRLPMLGAMLQQQYLEKLRLLVPGDETVETRSLRAKLFEPGFEKELKEQVAGSLGGLNLLKLAVKRWKTRKRRT